MAAPYSQNLAAAAADVSALDRIGIIANPPIWDSGATPNVAGRYTYQALGDAPALSGGAYKTIGYVDAEMGWPGAPGQASVTLSNPMDDGKTVLIVGVDSDFNIQSSSVVASAGGPVSTPETFAGIFYAEITAGGTNQAEVFFGIGGTNTMIMRPGANRTEFAVAIIPEGYTGVITRVYLHSDTQVDSAVIRTLPDGGEISDPFRVAKVTSLDVNTSIRIPEKTFVQFLINSSAAAGTTVASGFFVLELIQNPS